MDAAHVICPQCGYDLFGIPEERCPECGFGYDYAAIRAVSYKHCLACISVERCSITCTALATALVISPLSDVLGCPVEGRRMLVGGAFLAILTLRRIVDGPQTSGWRRLLLRATLTLPLLAAVITLAASDPVQARMVATALLVLATLFCWAMPQEFPFAMKDLPPEPRKHATIHRGCAVYGMTVCWLLVILSWLP
jgi:ribosomal protein L37E